MPDVPYDVSEAALKELYRDLGEDDPRDLAKLIDEAKALVESGARIDAPAVKPERRPESEAKRQEGDKKPNPPKVLARATVSPPKADERLAAARPADKSVGKPTAKSAAKPAVKSTAKRQGTFGPLLVAALALAGIVVFFPGLLHNPLRTLFAASAAKPTPTITAVLHSGDLANGHAVAPGEIYGVDPPPNALRVAIATGKVALVAASGATLRACSSEPFVIEARGASDAARPLVSSCDGKPAFIQAVIPPPQLPAALPADPLTPANISGGG